MTRAADHHRRRRRGFTLVEVIIAALLTAMLLGSISTSIGQLARAKATCRARLDAHLRADAALNDLRRTIASAVRADDLFDTRLLVTDDVENTPLGDMDRDEIMLFTTRLRPIRSIDFNGEGMVYETQFRIQDSGNGAMLWRRRDAFPDEYPDAGGMASPSIENILGLRLEAYDGDQWYDEWDSDYDGMPTMVRITVLASGARPNEDVYEGATAVLRTVVAIDRVIPPKDLFKLTPEELAELDARVLIEPLADDEAGAEAGAEVGTEAGGAGGGAGVEVGRTPQRDPDSSSGGGSGGRGSGGGTPELGTTGGGGRRPQ